MTVADSDAVRSQRYRLHKAGDHSLCKRCAVLRRAAIAPEGRGFPPDDLGKMRWLAGQLAEAYAADPGNALLARELRMTLQALIGGGGQRADDDLAGLFAELGAS